MKQNYAAVTKHHVSVTSNIVGVSETSICVLNQSMSHWQIVNLFIYTK